ncbi:sigma-70 family RNA polymerase sigma factor [Kitasatospora sp. NPDC094011]|uniref:sigma-70 family RNA polymerase sigma factor n=1 Tax=Kitasatospora sp. NPDC094011 TaxID=3364090 RepID=UPI003805DE72
MLNLTDAQISAAKANDIAAITAIIGETEPIVIEAAKRHSKFGGEEDPHRAEDLAQEGRVAVWRAVERFEGTTVAQFAAYIRQTIEGVITDARRAATWVGVSPRAAKDFEMALRFASGDPYAAERLAVQADPMRDRKMTPEQARGCRLAWQGLEFLESPAGIDREGSPITLGMVLAEEVAMPEDLIEAADRAAHRRTVLRSQVHRALGGLSERQRTVVKAEFGISPVPQYGPEIPDADLAADLSITAAQVKKARYLGKERFAALYLAGAQQW